MKSLLVRTLVLFTTSLLSLARVNAFVRTTPTSASPKSPPHTSWNKERRFKICAPHTSLLPTTRMSSFGAKTGQSLVLRSPFQEQQQHHQYPASSNSISTGATKTTILAQAPGAQSEKTRRGSVLRILGATAWNRFVRALFLGVPKRKQVVAAVSAGIAKLVALWAIAVWIGFAVRFDFHVCRSAAIATPWNVLPSKDEATFASWNCVPNNHQVILEKGLNQTEWYTMGRPEPMHLVDLQRAFVRGLRDMEDLFCAKVTIRGGGGGGLGGDVSVVVPNVASPFLQDWWARAHRGQSS